MSNIATMFKQEITRLARRELKKELSPLRAMLQKQRLMIATLKTDAAKLAAALDNAKSAKSDPAAVVTDAALSKSRFSPYLLDRLRKNKKLSRVKLAKLIGASTMTVKLWEKGKFRPSEKFRKALIWARSLTKLQIKKLLAGNAK